MPEFTYNPATGQGEQTHGGQPVNISSKSDSAHSEANGLGSLEEVQEHQLQQAARNLSRRANLEHNASHTSNEDVDRGNVNPQIAATEQLLMETQQKLHRSTSPVEQARLAAEAEKLAATLVQAQEQGLDPTLQTEVATEDIGQAMRAELGDEVVDGALHFAADNFERETNQELNRIFEEGEAHEIHGAVRGLQLLQKNPDWIGSEASALDPGQVGELCSQYGNTIGSQIAQYSLQLEQGTIKKSQVVAEVMRDPSLGKAIFHAAANGLISIHI